MNENRGEDTREGEWRGRTGARDSSPAEHLIVDEEREDGTRGEMNPICHRRITAQLNG
jgi:hypothetical protein